MLMIAMSLALSLFPTSSFVPFPQSQSKQLQQEKEKTKHPTVLNVPSGIVVQPITLPPGDNVWSVQIVSRGGFTGSGKGDLTMISDGMLYWSGTDGSCSSKLSQEVVQALEKVVLDANPSSFSNVRSATGVCADCYQTAMVVQHRTSSGTIRVSSASWEDVSQDKVPAEVMKIYESLMALKGCKPQ